MQRVCVDLPKLPSVYPMTLAPCVNMLSVARADTQKRALKYALISILLLVPCFWQSRLQAGDLSSHVYNAWLAQLIESGRAPGLSIVFQSTNVLFDLILSALFKVFGAAAAQRVSVSAAVLIFVWGAYVLASKISGPPCWSVRPPAPLV